MEVLGIRMFVADAGFRDQVDQYICSNIREVTNSKKFYGLSRISLEIVAPDEHQVNRASNDEILPQVLHWLKDKIATCKNKLEPLTEDMIVLYLNSDNSLTDCDEVDDEVIQDNEVVQDYKKLTRRKQSGRIEKKEVTNVSPEATGTPNYMKFSIEPKRPVHEQEWSIVASYKTKDRSYMVIAMLNGNLTTISVHYRPAVSAGSGNEDPGSPVHNSSSSNSLFDRDDDKEALKGMSTNRCAFGLKALDGRLFACGGYDRGECLKSTEVYDFETNQWSLLGEMKSARGRFSTALYEGKIYACGGSSGNHDMKTVECYDPSENKWQIVAEAPRGKPSPGIAIFQGKLYVLGGCIGQSTVSSCEMLDLETKEWKSISPMRLQRFQVAVTVFRNKIYAIGGTNGWKCLNEVEVYDPQTNEWSIMSHLNIARRGAGVDVYKGKIYVVGGNDGTSALNSTEIYDPETHTWSVGPTLSTHRANCGVAVLNDRLFAIGGFNGKKFLNSMEFLDLRRSEYWCNDMPEEEEESTEENQNGGYSTGSEDINQNGNIHMEGGDVNRNKKETVILAEKGQKQKQGAETNGDLKQSEVNTNS
ncbi:influenza virus NS1A-binding protein homolog B-like isoform X2 [Mercenaria mercenaria]|uniref:influenza virus NS1A-binding protein homolog B-like isoform X2 n=1 Tax=Mercenaria mercenaria TaxID=6596 RepID=UPI001E1E0E5C|nr:influenza virus NS1A-binding protein homolog B-like isoform X2 [Mercenaria mercenaria]